jgi:AMIN domain
MIRARRLTVFLLLAPIAAAQKPPVAPAEVTGVNVSDQQGTEIRIELSTTALVPEAKVIATYSDSLIFDLPGAVYHGLPHRMQVNIAGVRAVRLWMQSEDPPLTRVVVEFDRTEQYLVSSDGKSVVLRIGPVLQGASPGTTPNTSEVTGSRTTSPAGRGSASTNAASAIAGIFRRGPGKPAVSGNSRVWSGQPVPQNGSAAPTSQTSSTNQNPLPSQTPPETPTSTVSSSAPLAEQNPSPTDSADTAKPADATSAPVPSPEQSAKTQSRSVAEALPAAATASAPAIEKNSSPTASAAAAKPAEAMSAPTPSPEQSAKTQAPALEEAQPATSTASAPSSTAAAVPLPAEAPAAVPEPAKGTESSPAAGPAVEVASVAPSSDSASANINKASAVSSVPASPPAPAEAADATSEGTSAAAPEPATPVGGTPISAPDMAAVAVVANPGMRTEFQVKYVDQDTAYLDGGRTSGLTEGMRLIVKNKNTAAGSDGSSNPDDAVAELVVVGLAETSAVTEIHTPKRDVVPGDLAYLSSDAVQALVQQHALGATRKYPAVITFSEGGDALDEEARAFVPRPPQPSVNRASGRFGIDYSGTKSTDASQASSSSIGAVVRADFTRIGGTYWDFRGYWRGRLTSNSAASQQTLQDLINRTYHLGLTYENPDSRWVLGAGRLYLPWASSLDTLDGGYFGARVGHGITTGLFGGSTPDPTSWSYSPNRHIGGAFVNEEGGSYDAIHYSSTAGFGKSFQTVPYSTTTATGTTQSSYQDNRPFAFLENSVSYKRTFSIFDALQADQPSANPAAPSPGAGISRSFLTVRVQPFSRIEFSANHTYFRDIPTFDPQLLSTGLLDKYLFQGFSGGVRIEVVKNIAVYTDLGRSSRTGDAKTSLNQMYGITFLKIPKVDLHADAHYSRFTSSFGSGTYRAFSLSRNLGEDLHVELLAGDQVFTSSLAGNQSAKFLTTNVDSSIGALFFVQGGFTMYRGQIQNYNQWNITLGYRFDSKWKHK